MKWQYNNDVLNNKENIYTINDIEKETRNINWNIIEQYRIAMLKDIFVKG